MSGDTSVNTASSLENSKFEIENVDGSTENLGTMQALNASEALTRIESHAEFHEDNSQNALFSCSSSDNCDSKDVAIERALNLELSENKCESALNISQNSDTTSKTVEDADLEEPNLEIILSDDDYREHDSACGKNINSVHLNPTNAEFKVLVECENNSEDSASDHKAFESDIKLRLGCFIKLVDCQVLLKSMIATPDVPPKNKKRKLSGGIGSKKLKLKKRDTRQEPECFSPHKFKTSKSQNIEPMSNSTTLLSEADTPQTLTNNLQEKQVSGSIDKTCKTDEGKHTSQISSSNDSNIFTNMASFFLSASAEEHKPLLPSDNSVSSSEVGTNATDKLEASQQPIVRLFRLPSAQLTKDEQSERHDNNNHSKSQKVEDLPKNEKTHKESYQTNSVYVNTSKEVEESQFPFDSLHSKDDKFTKTKKRKHSKVSKSEKALLKSMAEKDGSRKSFLNETKKLKADEALKKLQDVIGIKPISSQGSIISKRIPKINQNVFGNAQSGSIASDKERRNPLELGAESLQSVQNQLEGAGWTRHKFSRSDKSNNPSSFSMPSRRNSNWERSDCGYQKRSDFATSRSPTMPERKTFRDDNKSSESHLNGSFSGADNSSRFSNMRRNAHSNMEIHRCRSSSRQTPLPSLQNFSAVSNISCDVQFLLKACNAIIDNNSNLSSEHQQQFNSACNRLREELEKLVHSSGNTPFQSPGSRISMTNSPTASLKDFNVDEIMGFLKPHLPQDIYEKFSKDVSRMGSISQSTERFHPISPQSSTSSTSHKESFLPHSPPKCFSLASKKCTSEMFEGMKMESGKANNQKIMEERLLKKVEKEIQILETLVRVQDQLSVVDNERTDGCSSDPDDSKPSKEDGVDSRTCSSTSKNNDQASKSLQKTENSSVTDKDPACNLSLRLPGSPIKHKSKDEPPCSQLDPSQSSEEKDRDKKLEEKIISLSRNALKSYYHKGNITSEEFKTIMKKAITKISESKCKDVSQPKVSRFIDSLVSNVISKRKKINN